MTICGWPHVPDLSRLDLLTVSNFIEDFEQFVQFAFRKAWQRLKDSEMVTDCLDDVEVTFIQINRLNC